jgi:hypothetical protein
MEIGIDSFGAAISDPGAGLTLSPVQRTRISSKKLHSPTRLDLMSSEWVNTIAASLWIQPRL